MPGLTASHWTSRIGAAWDALPNERTRKSATIGVSLAINALLVLALTAFASNGGKLPGVQPITLELVSSVVPKAPTVLPPPPAPAQPKPATPQPRAAAPTAPSAGPVTPPLTLPGATGAQPGVETIPAEIGPPSPAVPKGLQRYLEADPCADPGKRKLHPECKSDLRAATDAIPDREARAERKDRLVEVAKDLGVYNNCMSSHLGCAAAPDRTVAGAAIARATTRGRSPMSAGGPTGMDTAPLQRPNSYNVDPGFGD